MVQTVVVMGVSGTGKSVIGEGLAEALGYEFVEGDSFHSEASISKMTSGIPLDDGDRLPWLAKLADVLAANREADVGTVLACSALKRSYRDILRGSAGLDATFFLHLDLPISVLAKRIEAREHFMPASLLGSQFEALEPLGGDESGRVLELNASLPEVIRAAVSAVRPATT